MSRRNLAWARRRGGIEYGRRHYPGFFVLQTLLLAGAPLEAWLLDRPFIPALGWPMLAVCVLAQGLRWWCITTLREQWNTRVIIVPGLRLIDKGPYRYLRHPNYLAVVAEGVAVPLVHTAWLTALIFTVANLGLLRIRIGVEDDALHQAAAMTSAPPGSPQAPPVL
ncbi:isoprenylcysteine carboxyl methyltransferase family protein [Spirillospora sp. NBC_01491]|uniref:isoprenylcysteine carboxyl methyltransferase family protein n=1 Tax=Spirillospora sp. NBC_01491 TaxID=2976007 RepID=UPI002E2FB7E7|nr:isoprenylcysteine carboxylmethyltransferase family protein [Spirillospora sp. NBC_01491]